MQIHQTVEDTSLVSTSAHVNIWNKQNSKQGIYIAKLQNKIKINFQKNYQYNKRA